MDRFLILNADDFGCGKSQNEAIFELYEKGLITSASFMAVTDYSQITAFQASKKEMNVGVHWTLNSDSENKRWHSVSAAKSLTDGEGLYNNSKKLFVAKRSEIAKELEAQYLFTVNNGLKTDHADSHCGTLYGINGRRFFVDAFDVCAKYGLAFRFPRKPDFILRQFDMKKIPAPVKILHKKIVEAGEKKGVKLIDDLISNPWNINRIKNYDNLRNYYLNAVKNCQRGVTEIFLHPAKYITGENAEWIKRVYEYELLKSGDLLQAAFDCGIKVVSWSDFTGMQ